MTWQQALQEVFTSVPELLSFLNLPLDENRLSLNNPFPIKVPKSFAKRMEKGNWNDPLLKQVLPLSLEDVDSSGGSLDPLQENEFIEQQGVLKKFQHRLLVIGSSHCAVHCRYCFRRHFPYTEHRFSNKNWNDLITDLHQDSSISEVILSGGDPLTLPDHYLQSIIERLGHVPHLKNIRIHTRFPIVIPERLTEGLLKILTTSAVPIVTVLHINHAQEIDTDLQRTLKQFQQQGCILLNQAVLLRGVNDTVEEQEALWRRCFESGVMAYYLHQFDDVQGAGHFYVPIEEGRELMHRLRSKLPGFMVPKYVQEQPHAPYKIPL